MPGPHRRRVHVTAQSPADRALAPRRSGSRERWQPTAAMGCASSRWMGTHVGHSSCSWPRFAPVLATCRNMFSSRHASARQGILIGPRASVMVNALLTVQSSISAWALMCASVRTALPWCASVPTACFAPPSCGFVLSRCGPHARNARSSISASPRRTRRSLPRKSGPSPRYSGRRRFACVGPSLFFFSSRYRAFTPRPSLFSRVRAKSCGTYGSTSQRRPGPSSPPRTRSPCPKRPPPSPGTPTRSPRRRRAR